MSTSPPTELAAVPAVPATATAPPNPHYARRWPAGAVICGALVRGGTRFHQAAGQPEPVDEIVSGLF